MSAHAEQWALAIATVAAAAFVCGLILFTMSCAADLPEEPGIVTVVTADAAYPWP